MTSHPEGPQSMERVAAKLREIIAFAEANANANPSPHEADTWRSHARNCHDLLAALPALHAGEGARRISDIVGEAMEDAWNTICSDTGNHPDDIERGFEGHKSHLGFHRQHWARLTGDTVAHKLAALSASPSAPLGREEWRDISTAPGRPIAVELFYGRMVLPLKDQHGRDAPLPDYRDPRRDLGYWDGETFRESGTGHSVFETWRSEEQKPTHYRPLPAPPVSAAVMDDIGTKEKP